MQNNKKRNISFNTYYKQIHQYKHKNIMIINMSENH